MKEELRLFIDSVLRSDRSVVELLTADYTFLNERLAMHYGIENVKGARFRRVTLPGRVALRAARQRRHPDADGVSEPHVARAARRVDTGAHPRARRLPRRRPMCRSSPKTNAASRRERYASGSSSTARIRRASPATA